MRPSQQALVRLEQSQEPIEEQLTAACHILQLDPSSLVTAEACQNEISRTQQTTAFLGRHQWVLRWLLSRLQAKESAGASVRSEPKAWRLLELLMQRIPLVNVARHLNTHKYLEFLYETLQEALNIENGLDNSLNRQGPSNAVSPVTSGTDNTHERSESSNALIGSPGMLPAGQSSRKRKRSDISDSADQRQGLLERMAAVFRVLRKLLSLARVNLLWHQPEDDSYEREYVKAVLRCEPTTAAKTLGLSFEIIYAMLKAYEKTPVNSRHDRDMAVITEITEDSLDLWNHRSDMIDDVEGNASNEFFASHCLVPALLLIELLNTIPMPGVSLSNLATLLEHEVALHILIPARLTFSKTTPVDPSESELPSRRDPQTLTRYLTALRSSISAATVEQSISNSQSLRTVTLLSGLPRVFVHATRCSRWKGSKGRNDESSWPEAVFRELAEAAGIPTTPGSGPDLSKHQLSLLIRLLQVAIDNNIFLSTTLLRVIAISYCELFTEDNSSDKWVLTRQIFKLDANVFLIPSHDENIPQSMRSLQNPLLEALFAKIAVLACQSGDEASDLQQCIHQQIFLPLMQKLANARALSSFIRYWHQSLSDLEEGRGQLSPTLTVKDMTILEDQSNSEVLKSILENSLTIKQITRELDWLRSLIEPLTGSSPVKVKTQAFSALVILEAVLMSLLRGDNIGSLREQGLSLINMVLQQVRSGAWPKWHRWRLWRLLTQMNTLWPHNSSHEQTKESSFRQVSNVQYALGRASKAVEKGAIIKTRSRSGTSEYREAYEAFGWILSFVTTENKSSDVDAAFSEVKQALVCVSRLLNAGLVYTTSDNEQPVHHELDISWRTGWNGRPEGLKSQRTLAIALAACLVLQYPSALTLCSSTLRRDLFQSLYLSALSLGYTFRSHGTWSDISFVDIWECALKSEYILNHVDLKDDILGMVIDYHSPANSHDNKITGILVNELAVHSLLKLPIAVLRRKERERILDLLLTACLRSCKRLTPNQLSSSMSLMVRLMQLPNATAELATNASAFWDLATKCQSYGALDKVTLSTFEALVSLTLSHTMSTISQDRSLQYLSKHRSTFYGRLDHIDSLLDNLLELGLVKKLLIVLWPNQNSLKWARNVDWNLLRARFLEILTSDLKKLHREWTNSSASSFDIRSEAVLDAIASIPGLNDLAGTNSDSIPVKSNRKKLRTLVQHLNVSGGGGMSSSLPVAGFKVISIIEHCNKRLLLHSTIALLNTDLAPHDRVEARSIIRSWISSLREEEKLDLLQEIIGGAHEAEPALLCLRIAVSTIEDQSSRVKEALAQVYRSLCEMVKKSDGIRCFRLTTDCLESIILTRSWSLSQWEIDTTLACIVFMASSHAPELSTKYAGFIYSRLCGLMNGLLTVHRLKLRGRFHIIIPVLQSLLRCLFAPNQSTHARLTNSNTLPSWLPPTGLEAPQATAYARLLTSLCDPTISSVTTPGKKRQNENLTPATDKARKMAGQHLPYVLMEYIQCRLHSNLASAEVKQALMPGIYAILDSMSQETRRMVNAAMDSSGRAMFRALWTDYSRFRKWNES